MNKRVIKNASWIIGCRILQSVFALIINMLTARYLGPSNFGIINYAASLVAFVTPITNLGINHVLVNEIISHPNDEGKLIGTSIVLTFFSSVMCIVGLVTFVFFINPGETETLIVCFLYSLLLLAQSIELIQYWFQAKLLSKYASVTTLVVYLIISVYKTWLLVANKSIYWFAISNALDYILIAIFLIIIYKKKGGLRFEFSKSIAKRMLQQSYHYILPGMMGVVLAQSDRVMLKIMNGNEAVGLYSAAFSIAGLTSFVFAAIMDSMKPSILEYKLTNEKKYRQSVSRLFGIIIYLGLLQSIFITIFSRVIIFIMYGTAFFDATITLQIIVWYTSFTYFGSVRSIWILAEKKQKYLWIISLSGMILNLVLNFIMIPLWDINGAALATLITQLFSNFMINSLVKPLKDVNVLAIKGLNLKKIFN